LTTVQLLFSASDAANGNINFDLDVNAAFSSRFSECEFNLGGKATEARQGRPVGRRAFRPGSDAREAGLALCSARMSSPHPIDNPMSVAVLDGQQKYTQIDIPVLAIFNVPHSPAFRRTMEDQARAFEFQRPHARIIRIPNADHYIFQSNEEDVLRDIGEFIVGLRIGE